MKPTRKALSLVTALALIAPATQANAEAPASSPASAEQSQSAPPQTASAGGVFYEAPPAAPLTDTQKKAVAALLDRYPKADMAAVGRGTDTRQGPNVMALIAFGPGALLGGRFKTEVACSEVVLDRDADNKVVTAMYFLSPKTKGGVLVVDTPVSDAACAPKGDRRRTGEGQKAFRDFMAEHDAYSKNVFRSLFGN